MAKPAARDTGQLSLLDDAPAIMQNEEDTVPESVTDTLARQQAYDAFHSDYLRRFYERRREEIMQSGNPVRIRLLLEHDAREEQRNER